MLCTSDQENPTEALQKGAFKKSKGRKRGAGEVGRMTRSVRQHMAAPLELLSEYPVRVHSSRQSSPARTATALSTSARTPVPMPSPDAAPVDATASLGEDPTASSAPTTAPGQTQQEYAATEPTMQPATLSLQNAMKAEVAAVTTEAASSSASTLQMMPIMPPVSSQMMADVPSDEQLEMVLDDLPMLDADDSFNLDALDPAFLPTPVPTGVPPTSGQYSSGTDSKQQSVENSSASVSEDDASANSGSSMPSASPQSSPGMMSQSPSP